MREYKKGYYYQTLTLILVFIFILLPQTFLFAAEVEPYGGEVQIERGRPNLLFDGLGNILSLPKKIILLNPKIDSHHISPETERYLADFIKDNPETMKGVKVRINQWTPVGDLKRLIKNKKVSWWWRVFPGIPVTLLSSTTGRLLGGNHYNPFTDTIHIYSNDPAVLLHEAMHAKDFSQRAVGGQKADWYAMGRMLPPVALNQEYVASDGAISYLKEKGEREQEIKSYRTLHPAFGTYVGSSFGLPYGDVAGAMVGQVTGFWKQHECRVGYSVIDGERRGKEVIVDLNADPIANNLIKHNEEKRAVLNDALSKEEKCCFFSSQ